MLKKNYQKILNDIYVEIFWDKHDMWWRVSCQQNHGRWCRESICAINTKILKWNFHLETKFYSLTELEFSFISNCKLLFLSDSLQRLINKAKEILISNGRIFPGNFFFTWNGGMMKINFLFFFQQRYNLDETKFLTWFLIWKRYLQRQVYTEKYNYFFPIKVSSFTLSV